MGSSVDALNNIINSSESKTSSGLTLTVCSLFCDLPGEKYIEKNPKRLIVWF